MSASSDSEAPRIDFRRVAKRDDLAPWLAMSVEDVREMLGRLGTYYHRIEISRLRRPDRIVFDVTNPLRSVHKQIGRSVQAEWDYPDEVHGYVPGCSTLTHARPHCAKRVVLRCDLEDFFDSVTHEQVVSVFARLGAGTEAAHTLADLSTLDGRLPQGACSSPSISNAVLAALDADLLAEARAAGCAYTRYGDDMVFSGDAVPGEARIAELVELRGFRLNHAKTKLQYRGGPQYVGGLTVFDERPRLPRQIKDELRTCLHYINKFGFENHVARTGADSRSEWVRIRGLIAYLNGIEPALGRRYLDLLEGAPTGDQPQEKASSSE